MALEAVKINPVARLQCTSCLVNKNKTGFLPAFAPLENDKFIKSDAKIPFRGTDVIVNLKNAEIARRAGLSDEQIKAEAQESFDKAFDELEVPENLRPKLEVEIPFSGSGGSYNSKTHTINVNPEIYRSCKFEIDDLIMHEATHCKEALLRAGLAQDKVDAIIREVLIEKIEAGEAERILIRANRGNMMEPPKMSPNMKKQFVEFANENLYTKNPKIAEVLDDGQFSMNLLACTSDDDKAWASKFGDFFETVQSEFSPIIKKLESILGDNPDFVEHYSSLAKYHGRSYEPLNVLLGYSLSHNSRYNYFTNVNVGNIDRTDLDVMMKPENTARAIESLRGIIPTIEGNVRQVGKTWDSKGNFNQYQFSPEEVLAQKNGNEFLIKNLSSKMRQMKKAGTLTPEHEAYMTSAIDKAKFTIEYKTKGQEYYRLYTEALNNPDDTELLSTAEAMKKELAYLQRKLTLI